jgi:hypothetical protein
VREKLLLLKASLYFLAGGAEEETKQRECEISLSQLLETGGLPAGSENAKKKRYAKITTKTAFREKRND